MKAEVNRSELIKYLEENYGIPFLDSEYTFFYDETENIRKLTVDAAGQFNSGENLFCLGGIASKKLENINLTPFLENLRKKREYDSPITEELKFNKLFPKKTFADICSIFDSKKLTYLFNYMLDNEIFVHFFVSSYFFMLAGDIIFRTEGENCDREISFSIKDALYRFIKNNETMFGKILKFHKYSFHGDINLNFYSCLNKYYVDNKHSVGENDQKALDFFFDQLEENLHNQSSQIVRNELNRCKPVENFSHIFLNRILINRISVFDKESLIENILKTNFTIIDPDGDLDYKFVDSKMCHGIQLSDVVIRLIYMTMKHIYDKDFDELSDVFSNISETQRENIILFRKILKLSNNIFPYSFKNNLNLSGDAISKLSQGWIYMDNVSSSE